MYEIIKIKMAKVSKNAKTNRKSNVCLLDGKKVKPMKLFRNPMGAMIEGMKIPAGGMLVVQMDNGSVMMKENNPVLWSDVAHLITYQ
jgi:hypothetical protein